MSWKTDKSIWRLVNAFKRNKKGIFKEDIDALKHISEVIENSDRLTVDTQNLLYGKLLAIVIKERYSRYQDINLTIRTISKDLELPLRYHLELLASCLTVTELTMYVDTLSVDVSEGDLKDIQKLTEAEDKFWTTHQKSIFEKIKKAWSFSQVEKSFYNSANDFLKDINKHV